MDVQKIRKEIIALIHDDPEIALAKANMLVAKMPNEVWTLQLRSSVYESMGEIEKAFSDIDQVIKLNPQEPSPYFKKAMICVEIQNYEQAISEFSMAIEIGKMINFLYFENHCYFMRAFCYCKIGKFGDAKLDLDKVEPDSRTWIERLWTKEELVEACQNQRLN